MATGVRAAASTIEWTEEEELTWALQNMFNPQFTLRPFADNDDEMTDEMWDYYEQIVEETDGFEVPDFPVGPEIGQIVPLNFSIKENVDECEQYSKLAIETYNKKFKETKGELEFVEVLMGTSQASYGLKYYLTFLAKNIAEGHTYTYQSLVLDGLKKIEVMSFRLKPGQEGVTTKEWFWMDSCCGSDSESED